jgi:hypothetical protein
MSIPSVYEGQVDYAQSHMAEVHPYFAPGGDRKATLRRHRPPTDIPQALRFRRGGPMDIIIMVLLLVTGILIYRGAARKWILTSWIVALVLMLGLFRYHVTSPLDLSF